MKPRRRRPRLAAPLPLAALALLSCADILGLEPGHLTSDPDGGGAATGGASIGTGGAAGRGGLSDAANETGRGGNGADAATDIGAGGSAARDASTDNGAGDSAGGGGSVDSGVGGSAGTDGSADGGDTGGSAGRGGTAGTNGADASADAEGGAITDATIDRGPTCTAGQKLCGSQCVATTDPATGCAATACTPCVLPNATAKCDGSGQCALGTCSTGFENCIASDPRDGCETDLSKADTCGSCTNKCAATAPLCSGSNGSYQCVTGCTAPTSTLCGMQCVDVTNNPTHCGDCPTSCSTPTNGDPACVTSMCDFTCHGGFHKCTATKSCASDTDVNACGATCQKCVAPANGRVSCPGGECAITCNANYHLCNMTTCADDNSPATCGTTSCSACPAPSDPNADPAATCVNKTCGFKCRAGYNLCSGVCSDTNSVSTCGPNCLPCSKPANASTVTCNGTSCGFVCNPGYEPSGIQCVVASNLYVSASGSDSNAGTQASPFRTWKRAAQLAQSGTVVNFAAGTYDAAGGDDFVDHIPDGVTLQRSGSGTTIFVADGVHSLIFNGSGTLENITLTNFSSPLSATTGTQNIKGVTITGQVDPSVVTGTAVMVISDGSSISGGPTLNRRLFTIDSSAQLTMRDSTLTGAWEACVTPSQAGDGIIASGSATVSFTNVTSPGNMTATIKGSASSKISVSGSSLLSACGGGIEARDNTTVIANNTTFGMLSGYGSSVWTVNGGSTSDGMYGINFYGAARVSFRNFTLGGYFGVSISGAGIYDFGTSASPGNNIFNPTARDGGGLNVTYDLGVEAYGNTWVPNEQNADPSGKMPANTTVWGPVNGKNLSISSAASAVYL